MVKAGALFACTLIVVICVRIALTLSNHRSVTRMLPAGLTRIAPDPMVHRAARAVDRAGAIIPGASCLTRALALQLILAYRGFATELHIGVKPEAGGVAAHAWLLTDGRIAIGGTPQDIATYVPMTILESPKA